ncbi:DUF916 domain-containing protein [Candidatus Uhrbacteria bacterium]|nr:DUF916 domain-containing protein [Candidatus Uhrbacteria bacterium]
MKKMFFAAVTLFAVGLFAMDAVLAFTVDPSLISTVLNPGEAKNLKVTLSNNSETPLAIQPKIYSATAGNNETGFPTYVPAQEGDTLANWITFINTETRVMLNANESKDVAFTISAPADAAPGGHYAAIGWGVITDPTADAGATVSGEIMTNVALDVPGVVFEKGAIASFSTKDNRTTYDRLPIDFSVRVSNEGNRHFKPTGTIIIKDMLGRTAASLPVNEAIVGGGNVLPNSTREFKTVWKEGFALGTYTATANLVLGSAGTASASYSFWVLPTALLVIWGLIALVIIAFIVLFVLIARKKKTANRAQQ